MKKRILSLVLVLATVLSVTAVIVTGVPAKAVDDSNIILGTDGKITRAQWLHDLVYVFGMAVEEESLPDNYFADLDQSHKYYEDILLAVEYGVVDVEVGGLLNPDAFVTRAYAATTLNFCLGYQLSEEESYTFSDSADCTDPASAQIALNRGWFALAEGKFAPDLLVTEKEVEAMMDDATAVLEGQIVDAGYESKYEFAEDVTVIPEGTQVTKDEDGKLRIPDCPVDLLVGDKIAVYFNGIPSFYKITVLSFQDTVTVLEVEDLESDQALKDVDAQGVLTTDAMEIVAAEGVDVTVEDDTSAVSTYSVKKVKNIGAELPVSFGGITGKVSAKIKNPYIDYYVKSNKVYVALCGETEVKYGISGSLAGAAGLSKGLPLFTCNVGGIGSIDVTVNVDFAGSASGTVTGFLIAGVEVEKGVGVRAVKNFTQKEYYTSVEGETRVGLRASLGVTDIPVIKAYVYAEVGVKANFSKKTYQDESTPKTCTHFAAYLFASYGASASAKFGIWSVSESITHTIYDANNSPVRIVNHYEDGNLVPKCTRGTTYPNYFTTATSRWSGCGWTSSNGAYALNADGTPFKLYNYTLNTANEATITKYNGNAWTVHIPSEIDGHKVVAIGSSAFENKSLRSVTIPDGVIGIGTGAFYGNVNLQTVILSQNLESISPQAFYNCTSLSSIELPKTLTTIYYDAFYNCDALREINIPKALVTVYTNTGLASAQYQKDGPFDNCSGLKTVVFEEGVTTIPARLFAYCDGLEEVVIPDTVTAIGAMAFYRCSSLTSVSLSENLTTVYKEAFCDCTSLRNIAFPNSFDSIGTGIFKNCTSLESINITPNFANGLYDYNDSFEGPFYNCSNLKIVTFSEGVDSISIQLFEKCTGLEKIVIPETVKTIFGGAFWGCSSLFEVNIPKAVSRIYVDAFRDCKSLKSIEILSDLSAFGNNCFYGCTALESVILPNSLSNIPNYTFYNCISLKSFDFPEMIETIGQYAFYNCKQLENVKLSKASGLTTLNSYAFYNSALKELNLPSKTKTIGERAFQNCVALEAVVLPKSLQTLGSYAFMGCEALKEVSLADYSIKTINSYTFKDCPSLVSFTLPKGLTTVGAQAFMNCTKLEEFVVPESVTSINSTALSYPDKTVIYGKKGSYAETFAKDNGFTFSERYIPLEGMLLKGDSEKVVLERGEYYLAEFEIFPEDATEVITLMASNNNVTVDGHKLYGRYAGDTVITASTQSGLTYEFSVHVRSVKNIEITTLPTKTSYLMGEEFDKSGMTVQVNYDDSTSKTVENYTVSGFDSSKEGTVTLTVKWVSAYGTSYTKTFTVEIIDPRPKLTGIFVASLPAKTDYALREKLDPTGLVIMGNYTDGSTMEITDYTLSGYNALKAGRHTITVKHGDFSATFTVAVGITLTGMTLESTPTKTVYELGEALSLDGISLKLTYSDGAEEVVTSGFATSGFDSAAEGEKTVTVTYGAFSSAFTVTVKCSHTAKTLTPAKAATCKEGGWDAYYTCEPCGRIFAEDGTTELKEIPATEKDASKHEYDGLDDTACNLCGAERLPIAPGDVDGNGKSELQDALYLLCHIFFPERYPVNQPVDFDANGVFNIDDAIYLLFHVNFPDAYPLPA